MPLDELIKQFYDQLGYSQKIILGLGISAIISGVLMFAPQQFLDRRKEKRTLQTMASYAGVPAEHINPNKASSIARYILPQNGYLLVPVLPSENYPLASQLKDYYRHPAGIGAPEAIRAFLSMPSVIEYLSQPNRS